MSSTDIKKLRDVRPNQYHDGVWLYNIFASERWDVRVSGIRGSNAMGFESLRNLFEFLQQATFLEDGWSNQWFFWTLIKATKARTPIKSGKSDADLARLLAQPKHKQTFILYEFLGGMRARAELGWSSLLGDDQITHYHLATAGIVEHSSFEEFALMSPYESYLDPEQNLVLKERP